MARERQKIGSKRWDDPVGDDDGTRILVCRFRPRGVKKADETWTEWHRELGPSEELHARWYGKRGPSITIHEYERLFLDEMRGRDGYIAELARRVARGEKITLLCSSACVDPRHCHRTILIRLVDELVDLSDASLRPGGRDSA